MFSRLWNLLEEQEDAKRQEQYICQICVHCAQPQVQGTSSVIFYTETSVTLTKCSKCSQRLDPYVEYEFILIAFDLMLHRLPAFRHVISNRAFHISKWIRFTIVIFVVEVFSAIWRMEKNGLDVEDSDFLPLTLQGTFLFLFSFSSFFISYITLIGSLDDDEEHQQLPRLIRAFILSKFPSLFLLIAIAWSYPSDFYIVIAIYSFTISVTAVYSIPHSNNSGWKACLIAFSSVLPQLSYYLQTKLK